VARFGLAQTGANPLSETHRGYCVFTQTSYTEVILIGGLLQQLLFAAITFSSLAGSILMHRVPLGDGASEVRVDE
jgi:hypothetical protein